MMKTKKEVQCPVNFSLVNQNKVRLIALFVFLLSFTYLVVPHWSIACLLVADFFLRAFGMAHYSFLGFASDWIIKKLSISYKPVDSGPKEFAAVIGFIVSDVLFITSSLLLYDIGVYVAGVLVCFSFLEAAFNFCAGCYLYTFVRSFIPNDVGQTTASS